MFRILSNITLVSFLIPIVVGIRNYKILVKAQKYYLLVCIVEVLFISAETIMARNGINNHLVININLVINPILAMVFFFLISSKPLNSIVGVITILFFIASVIIFVNEGLFVLNQTVGIIYKIMLLLTSLLVIHHLYRATSSDILSTFTFWICAGTIIYCSGSLLVSVFMDKILQLELNTFFKVYSINWISAIISNLFIAKSFMVKNK